MHNTLVKVLIGDLVEFANGLNDLGVGVTAGSITEITNLMNPYDLPMFLNSFREQL